MRYLPSADHIIALGTDGTVVEEGTFTNLMANGKYIHSLGVKSTDSDSGSEMEGRMKDRPMALATTSKAQDIAKALDDRARQTGDITVYSHYFSRVSTTAIVLFILASALWGITHNFPTVWMKYWSEDTFGRSNGFYIGIFALFRVLQLVALGGGVAIIMLWFISDTGTALHKNALATVVTAPLRFFTTTDSGIVTNLFSQDMTLIDNELPMALCNVGLGGGDVLAMAAMLAVASPYMALSYPVLIAVLYVVQKFYLRTSRQIRLLDLEAKSPLYTHFLDTIKGVATIRAFGWTQHHIARNNQLLDTSQRPAYLLAVIQQWLGLTLQIVVAVIAIILTTLATQLRTNSGFTGASLVTLMQFGEAVTTIIRYYTMLETSIGAVSRLKTFSEKVVPEDLLGEDVVPPEEWPQNGQIEINGVSASYL
jgi:ATP-binding cassette, subfamily C (CFTR/MRP), member 1